MATLSRDSVPCARSGRPGIDFNSPRWRAAIVLAAVPLLVAVVSGRWRDFAGLGYDDSGWLAHQGTARAGFGASAAGVPAEPQLTNSLGMRMVWIPPGAFLMGSAVTDDDLTGDEKPHRVRITRAFYLAAHEVTVKQFRRFVEAAGYKSDAHRSTRFGGGESAFPGFLERKPNANWSEPGFPQAEDHPAVHVSWDDAEAFCRWLSSVEAVEYRLPTEAEWEYACRAGTATRFSVGDDERSLRSVANVWDGGPGRVYTYEGPPDGFLYTSPVGSFPANEIGLYDMHGNAWEWCADGYQADYYRKSPSADPQGPERATLRVMRGGSFFLETRHARSSNRLGGPPSFHSHDTGFRVALTPP
jgi:formylglycine-generating enzyme required for sulfatase activity